MSPPTKELMKLVLEQRIAPGGHPVLSWMMDNIFIRTDPAGNIKPDKEKSTEKIDGADNLHFRPRVIKFAQRAVTPRPDSKQKIFE